MNKEYEAVIQCLETDVENHIERIESLEKELNKLIKVVESQKKSIELLNTRMTTIRALAMNDQEWR